jgi:hypothetical protein
MTGSISSVGKWRHRFHALLSMLSRSSSYGNYAVVSRLSYTWQWQLRSGSGSWTGTAITLPFYSGRWWPSAHTHTLDSEQLMPRSPLLFRSTQLDQYAKSFPVSLKLSFGGYKSVRLLYYSAFKLELMEPVLWVRKEDRRSTIIMFQTRRPEK